MHHETTFFKKIGKNLKARTLNTPVCALLTRNFIKCISLGPKVLLGRKAQVNSPSLPLAIKTIDSD